MMNRSRIPPCGRLEFAATRRDFLCQLGSGFGGVALASLLTHDASLAADDPVQQHAGGGRVSKTHHRPRAKSVIFVFLEGGPSHIDLFDPKPKLNELAGKPLPESFGTVITPMGEYDAPLLASRRKWKQHGQSGTWVSDWLPHIATCVDDIAVLRSCWGNGLNHSNGVCQMNSGSIVGGRPSLGSWVTYGLGSENDSLPGFVVMEDTPGKVVNGPRNWSAGFMPASHQGVSVYSGDEPIKNLEIPATLTARRQRSKLDLLNQFNRSFAENRSQSELDARIESMELAFRMQAEAPTAVNLADETAKTQRLYGLDDDKTATFGRNCLLARRLVERGVRFVQLYHGAGSRWDAHKGIEANHSGLCRESDKPVAGLLKDLKQRGLLDDTLVIWGGEFGRTPMSEKGDGRDHNPYGFTMWMAGGGVRGGVTHGSTDELGLHAVEDRLHIHDLHATILWLLGVDPMKLVFLHKGRPERANLNEGLPFKKLV
jgi:hypothetical protein